MDNLRRQIQQLQECLERYEAFEHEAPPRGSDVEVSSDDGERMLILFTRLIVTPRVTAFHLILET